MSQDGSQRLPIQPTAEEISIMKSCSRAVVFQKCIPASLGLLIFSEYLHRKEYIKMRRFGRTAWCLGLGMIGVRYLNELGSGSCLKQVMDQVPDGMIAQRYGQASQEWGRGKYSRNYPTSSPQTPDSQDSFPEPGQPTEELADRNRPSMDNDYVRQNNSKTDSDQPRNTTYAELREKHRQQLERQQQKSQQNIPKPSWNSPRQPKPTIWDTPEDMPTSGTSPSRVKRNKYGDVWDE